ncbi:MAG: hypothetical protein J0L80_14360 [Chitinophagales bacterium]|nr:hypothetical protein [Chitinophagales bacterium]
MRYLIMLLLSVLLLSACKKAKINKITGTYTGKLTIWHQRYANPQQPGVIITDSVSIDTFFTVAATGKDSIIFNSRHRFEYSRENEYHTTEYGSHHSITYDYEVSARHNTLKYTKYESSQGFPSGAIFNGVK